METDLIPEELLEPEKFHDYLLQCSFVEMDGDSVIVHGWEETNAALFGSWQNGKKGGRPRKKPKQNPRVNGGNPVGNPDIIQDEPKFNPNETDKRREDKRGLDGNDPPKIESGGSGQKQTKSGTVSTPSSPNTAWPLQRHVPSSHS